MSSGAARKVAAALSDRRRWYALTGSVLGGVLVGALLWENGSRPGLARDLVRHLALEPAALSVTGAPADAAQVQALLRDSGVHLRTSLGRVSYARSCRLRSHAVTHLVLQVPGGPVSVLVLRDKGVRRRVEFQGQGYVGTIEPAGDGSIAFIGRSREQVSRATTQVMMALDPPPLRR